MATLKNEHDYITTAYLPLMTVSARSATVWELEWKDILDELYLALHEALPQFRGLNGASQMTFAHTVINNKIKDLRRVAGAMKRTTEVTYSTLGWTAQAERIYTEQ